MLSNLKVNAVLKGRSLNLFSFLRGRTNVNTQETIPLRLISSVSNLSINENSSEEPPKLILDTLKVSPSIKDKVKPLIDNMTISGTGIKDFSVKDIDKIESRNFYYQNLDGDGNLVTLVSQNFPKVVDVDGNIVKVEYKNLLGKEKAFLDNGLPIWLKGKDIIDFNKKNVKTLDLYTLQAPVSLKNKIYKLLNNNKTKGMSLEDFRPSDISAIKSNNFYYQRRESDNKVYTDTAIDKPRITDITDGIVTTVFTNTRGEKTKVYSEGLPMWLKGDLIKNKYEEKKRLDASKINLDFYKLYFSDSDEDD